MTKHVMVFNDTQEILQLFHEILTDDGFTVSLHSYTQHDVETIEKTRPTLIISDHPPHYEQHGWQFLQKIKMRRLTAHIPVVLCTTMNNSLREQESWLNSKQVLVVPKPFDIDELLHAVHQLVGKADEPGLGPLAAPLGASLLEGADDADAGAALADGG